MRVKTMAAAAALALAAGGGSLALAGTAGATTSGCQTAYPASTSVPAGGCGTEQEQGTATATPPSKAGTYQFASNESDGKFHKSDSPITDPAGSETLTDSGVHLNASGATGGYGSAAVIVDLGKLSTLFDASGNYVAPTVVTSSGTTDMNLYFDTDNNKTYLQFDSNGVYQGPGGDNLASMEQSPSADFTTFTQGNKCLSGVVPMTTVQKDFQSNKCGSATNDPEVWAWVGVQSSSATPVTATVTSVNGQQLVNPSKANGDALSFDVYQRQATAWNKVIAYPDSSTDPATDFFAYTISGETEYEYAPSGNASGLCVTVSGANDALALRPCGWWTWQRFWHYNPATDSSPWALASVAVRGDVVNVASSGNQFALVPFSTSDEDFNFAE